MANLINRLQNLFQSKEETAKELPPLGKSLVSQVFSDEFVQTLPTQTQDQADNVSVSEQPSLADLGDQVAKAGKAASNPYLQNMANLKQVTQADPKQLQLLLNHALGQANMPAPE